MDMGKNFSKFMDMLIQEIEGLLKTCDNGRIIKEGINTVILGKPNAGNLLY